MQDLEELEVVEEKREEQDLDIHYHQKNKTEKEDQDLNADQIAEAIADTEIAATIIKIDREVGEQEVTVDTRGEEVIVADQKVTI